MARSICQITMTGNQKVMFSVAKIDLNYNQLHFRAIEFTALTITSASLLEDAKRNIGSSSSLLELV